MLRLAIKGMPIIISLLKTSAPGVVYIGVLTAHLVAYISVANTLSITWFESSIFIGGFVCNITPSISPIVCYIHSQIAFDCGFQTTVRISLIPI